MASTTQTTICLVLVIGAVSGFLCPDSSPPTGFCRWGSKCPSGSVCLETGLCCGPATPCLHRYFQGPPCSLSNNQNKNNNKNKKARGGPRLPPCRRGYECTAVKATPGKAVCCYVPDVCPVNTLMGPICSPYRSAGARGQRGPIAGIPPCKPGYKCTALPYSFLGMCCSDNTQGICPDEASNSNPNAACPKPCKPGDHKSCEPFHRCCPEDCGFTCRRALYEPL